VYVCVCVCVCVCPVSCVGKATMSRIEYCLFKSVCFACASTCVCVCVCVCCLFKSVCFTCAAIGSDLASAQQADALVQAHATSN
jgi:hypothetical protein